MTFTIHSKKYGKHVVEIDDEDWYKVKNCTWSIQTRLHKNGRVTLLAVMTTMRDGAKRKTVYLHRFLVEGRMIDHINGNILDNRKRNLRVCNYASNRQNANPNFSTAHGFKGVRSFKTKTGNVKYFAQIKVAGKRLSRGNFNSVKAAAVAYNDLAVEHFGEFARLNKISGGAL